MAAQIFNILKMEDTKVYKMAHTNQVLAASRQGARETKTEGMAHLAVYHLMLGFYEYMEALERKELAAFQEWFLSQDDKEIAFLVEMAAYHFEIATDIIRGKNVREKI